MCYLHQKNCTLSITWRAYCCKSRFPCQELEPVLEVLADVLNILRQDPHHSATRPICPNHYPNILEEHLICCVVFRQRSLIRTHRELGKSSPEEDRCTSLLIPHVTVSCGFFCKNVTTESDFQTHLLINQHTRSVLVTFGTKRAPGN